MLSFTSLLSVMLCSNRDPGNTIRELGKTKRDKTERPATFRLSSSFLLVFHEICLSMSVPTVFVCFSAD